MAALITIQIPAQNFEVIRNSIGTLLAEELASQTAANDVTVWENRFIAFDNSELPAINVSYDNTPYDNHNAQSRRGVNKYYIDVIVSAKHSSTQKADYRSSLLCQKIAGIVAYILSSAEYHTLGLTTGLIQSRWVESLQMGKLAEQDSLHTIVCRVTFNVIAREDVGNLTGTPLEIISSQVKLNETEKGYKFELIKEE